MKNLGSLNFVRCLVESINIVMFLVFKIARNRYGSRFDANIIFAFISVENDCFRILSTTSRFGFLKIAFRNRSQFLRPTATTEAGENTVFTVQLSIKVLSSRTQAGFHERFLEVVAVVGEEKKVKWKVREGNENDLLKGEQKRKANTLFSANFQQICLR